VTSLFLSWGEEIFRIAGQTPHPPVAIWRPVPHFPLDTGMLTVAIAPSRDGLFIRSEAPGLVTSSAPAVGEGAPSLFSSLLRSDEPGGSPPAAAEVAQASRSHFRRTITARTSNPRCPAA